MLKRFFTAISYISLTLSVLFILRDVALAAHLTIGYIELPPYYFTDAQHKPAGFLIDLTQKIMDRAGHECCYKSMPSNRILHTIQKESSFVSIGWFKTNERLEYAKFSQPIYENKPIVVLIRRDNYDRFQNLDTLQEILEQHKFKTGLIAGHSMGEYVDNLLGKYPQAAHKLSGTTIQLVRMLHSNHIDFCLLAPKEIATIIEQSNLDKNDFYSMPMADISTGNKRYLMFSQDIPDKTIKKINKAIAKIKTKVLATK
ncbi:transporter substrate-binding domain-containing protein [Maridesulfovibrio sp.]|uniref:substrate-binding periplasmic protein n=1 Tax=Maridesulfovibrio sp. TaxID=2795000 RepID=UPI0029F4B77D|nr:transporter substrate-binding domain-containing protein [Maridesulfovibrio sp.]